MLQLFGNNIMRIIFIILGFILTLTELRAQQMPQFSQYLFNPIYLNPAYTGYKGDLFIQAYNRMQWMGFKGSPTNFGIAIDGVHKNQNLGLGFHAGNESIGFQSNSTYQAKISYHLRINQYSYLSFGTSVGFWNSRLDENKIDPIQKDDPLLSGNFNSIFYPDLAAGLFYYSKYFNIGASLSNLFGFNSFSKERFPIIEYKKSLILSSGWFFEFNDERAMELSFLFMTDNRSPVRVDMNINGIFSDRFSLGLGVRNQINLLGIYDDLDPYNLLQFLIVSEIKISENLRFGYSIDYDFRNSFQKFTSNEFSLSYTIKNRSFNVLSPRYF